MSYKIFDRTKIEYYRSVIAAEYRAFLESLTTEQRREAEDFQEWVNSDAIDEFEKQDTQHDKFVKEIFNNE